MVLITAVAMVLTARLALIGTESRDRAAGFCIQIVAYAVPAAVVVAMWAACFRSAAGFRRVVIARVVSVRVFRP